MVKKRLNNKLNKELKDNFNEEETIIPGVKNKNFDEEETIIPGVKNKNFDEEETAIPGVKNKNFDEEETAIPGKNNPLNRTKYKKFNETTNTDIMSLTSTNNNEEEKTFILPGGNDETNTQQISDINIGLGDKKLKNFTYLIKKYKNIIITVVGIFIFLILLIITLRTYNENKRRLLKIELKAKQVKRINEVKELYFLGINEYKLQKWESANKYFTQVLKLKPDYQKAIDYRKNSIKENKNKIILKEAKDYFEKKDYNLLFLKLKKITPDSHYYQEAKILKDKAIEEQNKLIKEKLKEEKELNNSSDLDKKNDMPLAKNQENDNILQKVVTQKDNKSKAHTKKKRKKSITYRKRHKLPVTHQELERARELYISAYQIEKQYPKKAVRIYKTIIKMLPSNESLYKKAKKRLKKLQ